ncbi:GGDEF domain-containing protein [Duganella vulcania]|uniref:diguanylate cyclase n=1 Tax=Duganella vulcania TaxID=2692166 RepID=A0A845GN77_9BURK|nr:GGDEF domain-containing protein [Duganella vulcania]MYM94885.1 diguanylate cyclase [Duganella vulcania]
MLDLRTINSITGIMALLMAFVLLGMRHYYPRRIQGTLMWGLSPIVGGLSSLAYGLDGWLPTALAAMLSNSLAFASAALNLFGTAAFYEHPLNGRRWLAFTVAVLAVMTCFMVVWPDYRVRVTVFALAMTVYTGVHASMHWRHGLSFAGRLLAALLLVRCAILLLRAGSAPFIDAADASRYGATWIQLLYISSFSVGGMVTCLGLVLLASERVGTEFERMANVDLLTGAASRRAIMQAFEGEVARWQRTGRVFSILLLDIDHFKRINDRHGHVVGDQVLARFAATVKSALRSIDTLGRYGGEEFIVLLPDNDLQGAAVVAERVRQAVEQEVGAAGLPACTTSIGCACISQSQAAVTALLSQADAALYTAKHEGRNAVRLAQPPPDQLSRQNRPTLENAG